nr:unnamed protein product [Callosobruchus chinensis]
MDNSNQYFKQVPYTLTRGSIVNDIPNNSLSLHADDTTNVNANEHPDILTDESASCKSVLGDLILGGLMMVHEREENLVCGPIMPQGGIQALETMLYTLDIVNSREDILPGISLGAHILDDCDKDTYGLEMAVDFIKGIPAICVLHNEFPTTLHYAMDITFDSRLYTKLPYYLSKLSITL